MHSKSKSYKRSQRGGGGADYSVISLLIVCFVGLSIRLFFSAPISETGETGPVFAATCGYGLCAIALFFLIFLQYGLMRSDASGVINKNAGDFLQGLLTSSFSIVSTLGIFMYLIWLYLTYSKQINSGKAADEYYQMANIGTVMIIFQLVVLSKSLLMDNREDKSEDKRKAMITNAVYLLTIINVVFISIMNIILAYFSTDG